MKTLHELAAALAAGKTTSVKLVEDALARIESYRARGGVAYIDVDAESALQAARASDQARQAGYAPGVLAGLPVSVKDLFDVQGQVTKAGSIALNNAAPATQDAVVVARLRQAGAVLLGRTNMSEFAFSGLGLNPHYGTPRAPYDEARVSGGSSSGAAVSVALGMAAAAIGTDTGGSIRIPSAFCGLTGFKPTAHRVPLTGALPLSSSLDSIGPLAVSVACCAAFDAAISGESLDARPADIRGLRLYVTRDFVCDGLDAEVSSAFEAALQKLSQAGANIVPFSFRELREIPRINAGGGLTAAEAWTWHRKLLQAQGTCYDHRVAQRIRRGAEQSATDYIEILAARKRLQAVAAERLRNADAWLMPTVAILPPLVESIARNDDDFFTANGMVLRNTSVINFLDGCATSLPTGEPGFGLSVCGLHDQDARVLQISAAIQAQY